MPLGNSTLARCVLDRRLEACGPVVSRIIDRSRAVRGKLSAPGSHEKERARQLVLRAGTRTAGAVFLPVAVRSAETA
jgi:hypothetical protein